MGGERVGGGGSDGLATEVNCSLASLGLKTKQRGEDIGATVVSADKSHRLCYATLAHGQACRERHQAASGG